LLHSQVFAAEDCLVLLWSLYPAERTLSGVQESRFHLATASGARLLGVGDLGHAQSLARRNR
jgi:hypothetical protein